MNETEGPAIVVRNLVKTYEHGRIPALTGADLTVQRGEFIAIMGPSGCGKSTLLHMIAALDGADSGEIAVFGHDLRARESLNRFRATEVGIIFQLHNLLPALTASENVQIPMFETGRSGRERRERAEALLAQVGLPGKADQRPAELSGGERQRVAIARALANDQPLLLADEPTGSLDSTAGARILDLIEALRRRRGLTIVMVTHDAAVAARADRIVRMLDGKVVDQTPDAPIEPTLLASAGSAVVAGD
ncbi:MAG: ABC transporter ATP-binding protein [Thermomicrobiales bacterium]|nr:ABC transporter ATP-binding protein [Thermomicrobiales bacterium]